MADDYNEDDPLSASGPAGQALLNQPDPTAQESKDDIPAIPGQPPRAQLYKSPSGEPGSAYYEEQRQKSYLAAQQNVDGFLKDITPYRDHIMELLKQPPPPPPEQAGAGGTMNPTKLQAVLATSAPYLAIGSKHMRDIFGAIVGGAVAPMRGITPRGKWEEMKTAHEAEDWVREFNTNQINQYKDVLNNRRLELEDAMKVMKIVAQTHNDVMMLDAINRKDLPGIISQLGKHEQAEQKRRNAIDNWDLERQKNWLSNKDNMEYATIVSNRTDGKIDLTKAGAEEFRKNLKAANKFVYKYEQFLEDTKAKPPEAPQPATPGGSPPPRYAPGREEEQKKTDPLGIRSNTPASDDERKKFQDEINSVMAP